jgi:hypothetical protein
MTSFFARFPRRIAPWLLACGLTFSPAVTPTLRAQVPEEPAPAGEGEKGRPLDGYIATGALVLLAFFIVGKSARR